MINDITMRFSQESLDVIKNLANLLELIDDNNDISILTKIFDLDTEMVKREIDQLQCTYIILYIMYQKTMIKSVTRE